jgi:hypothetical protein
VAQGKKPDKREGIGPIRCLHIPGIGPKRGDVPMWTEKQKPKHAGTSQIAGNVPG